MKILIASDIHGSAHYAQIIKEAMKKHNCDKLLLLGDLLYHGPRNPLPYNYDPKQVIAILNSMKEHIIAVRGNCDAEVDQMVLEFPIIADYTTIVMEDYTIFATHGHLFHPDHLPRLQKGDVFFFGHVHVPIAEKKDGIHIINPGSITLPKQDSEHSYGILENHRYQRYDEHHQLLSHYSIHNIEMM